MEFKWKIIISEIGNNAFHVLEMFVEWKDGTKYKVTTFKYIWNTTMHEQTLSIPNESDTVNEWAMNQTMMVR